MGISFNTATLLNGNGINISSVVSEIQTEQSGQLTAWQSDVTSLQTQATALTGINTDLSNLASAVSGLSSQALSAVDAASSESAIVSATAQSGAAVGNYSVIVNTLATTGTLYTDSTANATTSILPAGQTSGDLQFQIGGSGGTTANVAITAGSNDTLTTLAASINAQSVTNKWGVTATVVTDATGSRLAINSQATGASGALAITNNSTSLSFEPPVGGTNAEFSINGIPYASTDNTVTTAIPDVTLNLTSADSATPVTISVAPDTTSVSNSINNFVTEYNTVVGDLNAQFAVNPTTNSQGVVGSDSALRSLQSSLGTDVAYATSDSLSTSSGINSLASLGITQNNDGTLSVNTSTLKSALSTNPAAVQNFFTNSNVAGFADKFNADLTNLTDPARGILYEDLATNQTQQTGLNSEISNFQTNLASQKTQLTAQFSQVNASLEEYPFLLSEVTQELASISSTSTTPVSTVNTNTTPATGQATS